MVMNRPLVFIVMSVTYVISFIIHMTATMLFTPEGALFRIATDGTETLAGPERAQLWFEILSVWVPIIAAVGVTVWALVTEYRRQTTTDARRVRRV